MGTQINNNPSFDLTTPFYKSRTSTPLPNFAEWSAKTQFDKGLWNADYVSGIRTPIVDVEKGLVIAFTEYQAYKKSWIGKVQGLGEFVPADFEEGEARDFKALVSRRTFHLTTSRTVLCAEHG